MKRDRRVVIDSTNHTTSPQMQTPRSEEGVVGARTMLPRTGLLAGLAYAYSVVWKPGISSINQSIGGESQLSCRFTCS